MHRIAFADWIVFFLVLLATLTVVVLGHTLPKRSSKGSVLHHLLMGRALTIPMFVAATIITLFGSFFGVTQFACERGVYNLMTQGVFWYVIYIIAALVIVPKIRNASRPETLPDLLREKYGPVSEKIGAVFNFIDILPITFAIGLGVLIKSLTGMSHTAGMCLALGFVLLYSLFGRIRAAIFSDMFLCLVMYAAVILVVVCSVYTYGFDILIVNLPNEHWDPFPEDLSLTFMWGFFALATLTDPKLYNRCFACTSTVSAQKGMLISTFFWFIFDICTTLGAMYARAVMPDVDPQDAYLSYALDVLPSPLRGLMLAGIFATVLSAIDTYLVIGSMTLFKNLLQVEDANRKSFKCIGMVLVGSLSTGLAHSFDGSIYLIWKTLGSLSSACLLAPLMVGLFSNRKISDWGFASACLLGILSLTIWKYLPRSGIWAEIDEFYLGLVGSMAGIAFAHLRAQFSATEATPAVRSEYRLASVVRLHREQRAASAIADSSLRSG